MQPEDNKETIKYGQTPDELTKDKKISGSERGFFQYFHSLPGKKRFDENPNLERNTFSKKKASKVFNVSEKTIFRRMKRLKERGWISYQNLGKGYYKITLHAKRRRRWHFDYIEEKDQPRRGG